MSNLKVNQKKAEVSYDEMIARMTADIKEMDADGLNSMIEYMYSVKVKDVEGMEGEIVEIEVDEEQWDEDTTLNQIF